MVEYATKLIACKSLETVRLQPAKDARELLQSKTAKSAPSHSTTSPSQKQMLNYLLRM